MKIFVTGGAGFIGGNFILKQILQEGNASLNYDKLTYAGNLATLSSVEDHPNYQFIQADICNRNILKSKLKSYKPDAIVHFAAESHVDRSIDGPSEFIQTNIMGTAVLPDGKSIGSNEVSIVVQDINIELRELIQDQNTLMRVAHNSGGVYMPIESLDSMFSHIDITPVQFMKNHQISGLSTQNYWWMLIIFLSIEWFVRKKLGLL